MRRVFFSKRYVARPTCPPAPASLPAARQYARRPSSAPAPGRIDLAPTPASLNPEAPRCARLYRIEGILNPFAPLLRQAVVAPANPAPAPLLPQAAPAGTQGLVPRPLRCAFAALVHSSASTGLTCAPVRCAQPLRFASAFSPQTLRETASGLGAIALRSSNGGTRLRSTCPFSSASLARRAPVRPPPFGFLHLWGRLTALRHGVPQPLRSASAPGPKTLREKASVPVAPALRTIFAGERGCRSALSVSRPPALRRFISGSFLTGAETAPLVCLRPLRPPLPNPLRFAGAAARLRQTG